jgi:hypothetical protein
MLTDADMPSPPPRGAEGVQALPIPAHIPAQGVELGILRIGRMIYRVKAFPPDPAHTRTSAGRPRYFLRGVRGALHGTMRNVPNPDRMFTVSGARTLATLAWLSDAGGVLRVIG